MVTFILFGLALFALGFLLGYYLGRDRTAKKEYPYGNLTNLEYLSLDEEPEPLPTENRVSGPVPDQEVLLSILRQSELVSLMNDPKLCSLFPPDPIERRPKC